MITTFPHTFFAYLDLLGFSQFVLTLASQEQSRKDPASKQQILLYYYNVLEPLVNGSIFSAKRDSQELPQTNPQTIPQTIIPFNITSSSLNSLIVSDSIFLWTDDQSLGSLLTLIDAVKHIIRTNFLWDFGFPLRGGISMGSVTFQKVDWDSPKINSIATIVGDALVKAAMLEKMQQWAGCIVDDDVIIFLQNALPDLNIRDELTGRKAIIGYPAPIKNEIPGKPYNVVMWPETIQNSVGSDFYEIPIRSTFERNGPITDSTILEKLNNTLDFVRFIDSNPI
ncbi:MAG: hypothetical protein ACTSYI_01575 [Promethearchaeota archaeon]